MRRLILQMQMSVDGFVAARDPSLSWTLWDWMGDCPWDPALKARFNATLAGIDAVLLSGPMADGYIGHWTRMAQRHAGDPDYAFTGRIVAAHKRVVSRSVERLAHPRTKIVRGPLTAEVQALKAEDGADIICFGGVRFASALLAAGLVDELQLYVNPWAIAAGESIFKAPMRMACVDAERFECGIVVQRYLPLGHGGAADH
jgi:dihydrofolate reductase